MCPHGPVDQVRRAHGARPQWIVGVPDIAKIANVREQTVATWRYRGILPEPDAVIASVPLWRVHRIARWLANAGAQPEAVPAQE